MQEKMYGPGNDPLGEYRQDLHREENNPTGGQAPRLLKDIKALYNRFHAVLTDDQMATIQILPVGTRLEQGTKYVDLAENPPREITATSGMVAEPRHYYVAKSGVDYPTWNFLTGVTDPARLDEGNDER